MCATKQRNATHFSFHHSPLSSPRCERSGGGGGGRGEIRSKSSRVCNEAEAAAAAAAEQDSGLLKPTTYYNADVLLLLLHYEKRRRRRWRHSQPASRVEFSSTYTTASQPSRREGGKFKHRFRNNYDDDDDYISGTPVPSSGLCYAPPLSETPRRTDQQMITVQYRPKWKLQPGRASTGRDGNFS